MLLDLSFLEDRIPSFFHVFSLIPENKLGFGVQARSSQPLPIHLTTLVCRTGGRLLPSVAVTGYVFPGRCIYTLVNPGNVTYIYTQAQAP